MISWAKLKPPGSWQLRLLGPVVLVLLILRIGPADVSGTLTGARLAPISLAVGAVLVTVPLRAWRWKLLLPPVEPPWRRAEILRAYAHSIFIGSVTPGRVGELLKARVTAPRVGWTAALSSSLLDRVLDLTLLIAVGGLAAPWLLPAKQAAWFMGLAAATLGIGVLALWASLRIAVHCSPIIEPRRLSDHVVAALASSRALLSWDIGVKTALLTLASWALNFCAGYLAARSLELPLSLAQVAGVSALGSLASLLPVSVLGAGTRDAVFVVLLAPLGIAPLQAVALSTLFLGLAVMLALACSGSLLIKQ